MITNIVYTILIVGLVYAIGSLVIMLVELCVVMGWGYVLGKLRYAKPAEIITYFRTRAERKVFLQYLAAMTTPFLPSISRLYLALDTNGKSDVAVVMQFVVDNDITISIAIAICVTIAYCMYVVLRSRQEGTARAKEIAETMAVINKEFVFNPNKEWFCKQTQDAIVSMRSRYDKEHNLEHPQLPLILASLRRDDLGEQWIEDLEELLSEVLDLKKHLNSDQQAELQVYIDSLKQAMNTTKWTMEVVQVYREALNGVAKVLSEWHESLPYNKRNLHSYTWSQYERLYPQLAAMIYSNWVECLSKQCMLITGGGGMGKSHLMGNIADERCQNGDPTILVLGAWISDGSDPWQQILSRLDVKCQKKETFLSALEQYAIATGKRVQILIDAINESKGDRKYWADNIDDFLSTVSPYPHIGIVLSLRTTSYSSPLDGFVADLSHATYEVEGFEKNLDIACEYMFDSYGLTPPNWFVADGIFAKPLWLHMYCESHALSKRPIVKETHLQIVQNYLDGFNHKLAEIFGYSKDRNVLQEALYGVAHVMVEKHKFYSLNYDEFYQALDDKVGTQFDTSQYFKELLHLGIVQQEKSYKDEVTLHFEYESFGLYLIAYVQVRDYPEKVWMEWGWNIGELTEVVPEVKGRELFTYYDEVDRTSAYHSFIETLSCRTALTKSGEELLDRICSGKDYDLIFRIISSCAANPRIQFNARYLDRLLHGLVLMDRDAIWTTEISQWSDTKNNLLHLAEWGMHASQKAIDALDDEVARLMADGYVWSFCSTNGQLRDTATKAMVNLLKSKADILVDVLEKYHDVNDPYVLERLWGVAFGCCTQSQNAAISSRVAKCAYEFVFMVRQVVENILVRDYAQLIIDYAQMLGCSIGFDASIYKAPFNTYASIPEASDDYIVATYEQVYRNHKDKDTHASGMAVIDSMIPEYSRRGVGGYGDFGRYTFQYALNEFPEEASMLSNWATDMIFKDFGYRPEDVKMMDAHAGSYYSNQNWERIGKKYQWMALHRIAAILSDYHAKDAKGDDFGDRCINKLRNIDPTILPLQRGKYKLYSYQLPSYSYTSSEDKKWIQDVKDMPILKECVVREDAQGVQWVNLQSYLEYTVRKERLSDESRCREVWMFIQSCFVDKCNATKACRVVDTKGLGGRSFDENHDVSNLYAGEWYWSENYQGVVENGYEYRPFRVNHGLEENFYMRPALSTYFHEYTGDKSSEESETVYYPNGHIVDILGLKRIDMRGVWGDAEEKIAIYDNGLTGGDHALMIRKDLLMAYLKKTKQVVIWPILIEKRLKGWKKHIMGERNEIKQCGGYVMMDEYGKMKCHLKQYEKDPTTWDIWRGKYIKTPYRKLAKGIRNMGVKLHIVKVSEEEYFNLWLEDYFEKIEAEQ